MVKHAQTKRVNLSLQEKEEMMMVRVVDDGIGFDPAAPELPRRRIGGFGLNSIRDRLNLFGGRLEIDSQLGKGTRVTLIVPKVLKLWAE